MNITHNGLRIEFESDGDEHAPAVVLTMGLGMQLTAWPGSLVQAIVQAGYRVIRFDQVGPAAHHLHPGARIALCPAAGPVGALRAFDRFGQLVGIDAVQFRLHPTVGRPPHDDGRTATRDPSPTDEIIGMGQADLIGVETGHGIISFIRAFR